MNDAAELIAVGIICLCIGGCLYFESSGDAKLIRAKAEARLIDKKIEMGLTNTNLYDTVIESKVNKD